MYSLGIKEYLLVTYEIYTEVCFHRIGFILLRMGEVKQSKHLKRGRKILQS